MKTNWLAYYNERKQFRSMMRGLSLATRDSLAFLDVTKKMQDEEGLNHKTAKQKLCQLLESRQKIRSETV